MSMAYIRKNYGVPVARGRRVEVRKENGALFRGTITRATHYVFIRIDGEKHARPYHPTDPCVKYLPTYKDAESTGKVIDLMEALKRSLATPTPGTTSDAK